MVAPETISYLKTEKRKKMAERKRFVISIFARWEVLTWMSSVESLR